MAMNANLKAEPDAAFPPVFRTGSQLTAARLRRIFTALPFRKKIRCT